MTTSPEQAGHKRKVPLRDLLVGVGVGYVAGSVSFSRLLGQWRAPGVDFSHAEIYVDQTGETIVLGGTTPTSVGVHLGGRWAGVAVGLEAAKAAVPTALAAVLSILAGAGLIVASRRSVTRRAD